MLAIHEGIRFIVYAAPNIQPKHSVTLVCALLASTICVAMSNRYAHSLTQGLVNSPVLSGGINTVRIQNPVSYELITMTHPALGQLQHRKMIMEFERPIADGLHGTPPMGSGMER